jgi:hypothetical protein
MIKMFLIFLAFMASTTSLASQNLVCTHYIYQDIPFVTISMSVDASGRIDRLAEINHYGTSRQTAVEENQTNQRQLYNLTIEADNPGNELFLEIYRTEDFGALASYTAKLINPSAPSVKEMPGTCQTN